MNIKRFTLLLTALSVANSVDAASKGSKTPWGGAWGYATSPTINVARDVLPAGTYRYRLRSSQSGDGLRLTFANPEGAVPLDIARVTVARAAGEDGYALLAATERAITFAAGQTVRITGGDTLTSLPVDGVVKAGDDLIVSLETQGPSTTVGGNAGFPLAFSEAPVPADGTGLQTRRLRPFVTQLAVRHPAAPCTIVTLGDSITEGARGTRPGWRGWPGVLASRLSEHAGRHCGVVNMGISGNRLLREGRGTAAVERFDRDVSSVPAVTHLILLEGINDIWRAGMPGEPAVTSKDLIQGYSRLIAMAHKHGISVIGGTMTPGWGSKYLTPAMEQIRQDTNRWIRTSRAFDAVIDFEAAVRDGQQPPVIKPSFDSGDHLHPGDAGYEAMGLAVPLSLLRPRR